MITEREEIFINCTNTTSATIYGLLAIYVVKLNIYIMVTPIKNTDTLKLQIAFSCCYKTIFMSIKKIDGSIINIFTVE